MKDNIDRVAKALNVGVVPKNIRHMLLADNMSEYEAWLTYIAGKMLYESRLTYKRR